MGSGIRFLLEHNSCGDGCVQRYLINQTKSHISVKRIAGYYIKSWIKTLLLFKPLQTIIAGRHIKTHITLLQEPLLVVLWMPENDFASIIFFVSACALKVIPEAGNQNVYIFGAEIVAFVVRSGAECLVFIIVHMYYGFENT